MIKDILRIIFSFVPFSSRGNLRLCSRAFRDLVDLDTPYVELISLIKHRLFFLEDMEWVIQSAWPLNDLATVNVALEVKFLDYRKCVTIAFRLNWREMMHQVVDSNPQNDVPKFLALIYKANDYDLWKKVLDFNVIPIEIMSAINWIKDPSLHRSVLAYQKATRDPNLLRLAKFKGDASDERIIEMMQNGQYDNYMVFSALIRLNLTTIIAVVDYLVSGGFGRQLTALTDMLLFAERLDALKLAYEKYPYEMIVTANNYMILPESIYRIMERAVNSDPRKYDDYVSKLGLNDLSIRRLGTIFRDHLDREWSLGLI